MKCVKMIVPKVTNEQANNTCYAVRELCKNKRYCTSHGITRSNKFLDY